MLRLPSLPPMLVIFVVVEDAQGAGGVVRRLLAHTANPLKSSKSLSKNIKRDYRVFAA